MLQSSADKQLASPLHLAAALNAAIIKQLGAPEVLSVHHLLAMRSALWDVKSELEELVSIFVHPSVYQRTRNVKAAQLDKSARLLATAREVLEADVARSQQTATFRIVHARSNTESHAYATFHGFKKL